MSGSHGWQKLLFFLLIAMNKYSVPGQLQLNLGTTQFPVSVNRTTREVCQLIQEMTGNHISSQEVLHQGKAGSFELPYSHGLLIVSPSNQERPNRLWRWDIFLVPTVTSQRTA